MNGKTLKEVADISDLVHARMKRIVNKPWNEMVPQMRLEITELEGRIQKMQMELIYYKNRAFMLEAQIEGIVGHCLRHNHSGCVPAAQLVTGQILRMLGRDEVRADEIQELVDRGGPGE